MAYYVHIPIPNQYIFAFSKFSQTNYVCGLIWGLFSDHLLWSIFYTMYRVKQNDLSRSKILPPKSILYRTYWFITKWIRQMENYIRFDCWWCVKDLWTIRHLLTMTHSNFASQILLTKFKHLNVAAQILPLDYNS